MLILLIPVLSLCGATEYYVRPTEPTNTSCPAQPCLTLNQYINDSERYFKSNTAFKFLPGTHHMNKPLHVGNVHSMSLESFYGSDNEQPHLVAEFSCESRAGMCMSVWVTADMTHVVCCAAMQFYDSQNITLKGIMISLQAPGMSGVTVQKVSNMNIQLITTYSLKPFTLPYPFNEDPFGIVIDYANGLEVYSSDTANYSRGFVFQNILNTIIHNITATYCRFSGIFLHNATNTTISSPKAVNTERGLSLYYASTNIHISDAILVHNRASGMYLYFINHVTISNVFAMFNGEGIVMLRPQNTEIINATVIHSPYRNIFMSGGTYVSIINTRMPIARDDVVLIIDGYIVISSSSHTEIINGSFTGFHAASNAASNADPINHPAVIVPYDSSLYLSGCNFTGNSISAVKAYASNITASGDLMFSSNRAMAGTAFVLVQDSFLRLAKGHIHFSNNYAINTGGVFYITNNVYYTAASFRSMYSGPPFLQSTCFVNILRILEVKMTFVNNSAGKGGDILYGGHVALGLDGGRNCLENFKYVSKIWQNSLSLIASDPSRVCFCNETGHPDCLTLVDPTPHSIYPGQSFNISAVVVGQQFGAVSGSVNAHFLHRSVAESSLQLDTGQETQDVTQEKCNSLHFTIFS